MAATAEVLSPDRAGYKELALQRLPAPDAPIEEHESAVAEIIDGEAGRALLETVLSELWRRRERVDADEGFDALAQRLQHHLLERDQQQIAKAVEERRAADPDSLQARLLHTLAGRRRSPSQLAEELHVTKETVSRALRELAAKRLVIFAVDEADARRRLYQVHDGTVVDLDVRDTDQTLLTEHGELQHAQDLRYGPQLELDREAEREAV